MIRSAGLKGKSLAALVRGAALMPLGGVDAWRLISRRRPDVVIGGTQGSALMVFSAAEDAAPWAGTFQIAGKAQVGGSEVTREARRLHVGRVGGAADQAVDVRAHGDAGHSRASAHHARA